jgi:hypothetical protein
LYPVYALVPRTYPQSPLFSMSLLLTHSASSLVLIPRSVRTIFLHSASQASQPRQRDPCLVSLLRSKGTRFQAVSLTPMWCMCQWWKGDSACCPLESCAASECGQAPNIHASSLGAYVGDNAVVSA